MEINNISKEFNQDNIPRCPNCNLISLLQFLYQNNQPIINFLYVKKDVQDVVKIKKKLKQIFFIVVNVINFYVILVY